MIQTGNVKKKTKGRAKPEDIVIGKNLRMLRLMRGMSQEKVADLTGVTFQQIQKYENGSNRIAASTLYKFSNILDVDFAQFYSGLNSNDEIVALRGYQPEVLKIASLLDEVKDKKVLKSIKKIILQLSDSEE